jgi:hypothetical protein
VSHPLSGDKILNSINMFCWFCRLTAYLILVYLSVKYRYFMNRKLKQWWSTSKKSNNPSFIWGVRGMVF